MEESSFVFVIKSKEIKIIIKYGGSNSFKYEELKLILENSKNKIYDIEDVNIILENINTLISFIDVIKNKINEKIVKLKILKKILLMILNLQSI